MRKGRQGPKGPEGPDGLEAGAETDETERALERVLGRLLFFPVVLLSSSGAPIIMQSMPLRNAGGAQEGPCERPYRAWDGVVADPRAPPGGSTLGYCRSPPAGLDGWHDGLDDDPPSPPRPLDCAPFDKLRPGGTGKLASAGSGPAGLGSDEDDDAARREPRPPGGLLFAGLGRPAYRISAISV